jgi:hypothetical protein
MEMKLFRTFGMITLVLAIVGCSNTRPLIKKDTELDFYLSNELKEVLYYASLAPNGHNTQMWKVGVSENGEILKIFIDSSRLLPVVDPNGRESLISVGAFIENMKQALFAYGFKYELSIIEEIDIKNNPFVAEINIKDRGNGTINYDILNNMQKRHTDKSKYLADKPLDGVSIDTLTNFSDGNILIFQNGSSDFNFIKEITLLANEIQALSPEAREELANWLRFSDEEAIKTSDGLPAEQLGLSGIVKKLYYATTNREKAKTEKFGKTSFNLAKSQLNNCMAFLIVTGGDTPKGYIEAGMKMESLWLKAVELNISVHPMSQALEEKETNGQIKNKYIGKNNIQMIMRAGYVKKYGTNNGIRRPLKEFVFLLNQ